MRGVAPAGGPDNAQVDAAMARFMTRPAGSAPRRRPSEPDGLDQTPIEQRLASVEVLTQAAAPSGEDQSNLGKLVASLAATSPEQLTPAMLAQVTATCPSARSPRCWAGCRSTPARGSSTSWAPMATTCR
jgi:hypothetical protein